MNLRQLEFFDALAREQHFGRAAAACHVSQPALSVAIRKLEHELGLRLVARGSTATTLTGEGEALLGRVRAAVSEVEAIAVEASGLRGHLTATLRLGVVPTAIATVSPVVSALLDAHPGVRLEVRTGATAQIAMQIAAHELDAGLAHVDEPPPGLLATPLYRERLVLLTTERVDATADGSVTWAGAAARELCLLTRETRQRQLVDAAFAAAGVAVQPRIETDSIPSLLRILQDGWSTVIGHTWFSGRAMPAGVHAFPLTHPVVESAIGLLSLPADRTPPVVRTLLALLDGQALQARVGALPA